MENISNRVHKPNGQAALQRRYDKEVEEINTLAIELDNVEDSIRRQGTFGSLIAGAIRGGRPVYLVGAALKAKKRLSE